MRREETPFRIIRIQHTLSGGGNYDFVPPGPFDRPIFQKKARRRRKNFGIPFFQKN